MPRIRKLLLLMTGLAVLGLDRLTKWWALDSLRPQGSADPICGLLRWVYVENRGVAFGLFQNNSGLFAVLALLVIIGIVWQSRRWLGSTGGLGQLSVALIVTGGIGNLIDRVLYGFVVDFIHLVPLPIFQVFNVADMSVSLGAVLLFITLWREDMRQRRASRSEGEAAHG